MVQNYMETLVDNALSAEFREHPEKYTGLCKCALCRAHIKVTALNNLDPFYVTSLTGEVFGEYQNKGPRQAAGVLVAVGRGIEELERRAPHPPGA